MDVTDPGDAPDLVARAYEEVMAPAFTREELPDLEMLVEGLGEGRVGVLSIVVDDGAPLAAAVSSYEAVTRIGLLEYMATRPERRGGGRGTALLEHQATHWATWPVDVVLAEVRDPRAGSHDGDDRPDARLRFYERFGARLVMVPWVQPALRAGLARVQHELLLSLHPDGLPSVDGAALALWAAGYFELSEGAVPHDGQYRAVMAGIEASNTVPVRPLSELAALPTTSAT